MAGYLTHVMVLIKAEIWLGELIAGLEARQTTAGACLSDVEEALLGLARNARSLLRVDPAAAAAQRLPATAIENGVGTGLSKYALVGSIGMDFPINGYVLALNRDWVSRTMRLGAPRRAYVDAGSTDFVLNFINALSDSSVGLNLEQQRAMRSYALGHLAGIAADVVLQPAINAWTWSAENTGNHGQHHFKVQLDARVAHGFFQRDDLRQGQSWEDYFIANCDIRDENEKLPKVFLKAFTDTYGGTRPTEVLCATTTCRAPEITEAFLKDGYANTKGWAIGVGYDQSPWYWYKWLLGVFIFGGGMVSVALIWSSTSTYNLASWRAGDGFKTERLWNDLIGAANTWAGVVYMPFTWLAKFPLLVWDGLFGEGLIGSTERPAGKAFLSIFKGVIDGLSFVFDRIMNIAGAADPNGGFYTTVDPFVNQPYIRWPRFGLGFFLELLKTFWIDMESVENGEEGDRLGFTMFWPVKVTTFGVYFVSVLIVFGAKSARKNADGVTTEDTTSGWDYLIGMICPVVFIAIAWGTSFFEGHVLEKVAGARWPGTDTGDVDRYLPVATNGTRHFTATGATGFPVRLFDTNNQGVITTAGREHYAEAAAASPWDSVRRRDDVERKNKSQPSSRNDYKMSELIDHAAHLAGLLAMAAVNYEASAPRLRDSVKEIFKDWNLDYRTIGEWDALMKEPSATDRGLLTAVAQWTDDLINNRPATDSQVLARIEQEMAVTGFAGKIIADFTHAGLTPRSSMNPLPSNARCARLARPGAIILANLDFDEPIAVLPASLPDRSSRLDALKDNSVDGFLDSLELTEFRLERPSHSTAAGYELVLQIHTEDAARVRIFEIDSITSSTWPRRFGADVGGTHTTSHAIPGAGGGEIDFSIEALTLPGDPFVPAPTAAPPLGRDGVTPVAPARLPGDVWLELIHRDGGTDLPNLKDVVLFTIAPFLLLSNLQPTERVYIAYFTGRLGNHPTVADVIEGLTQAMGGARVTFGATADPGGGTRFIPHRPLAATDPAAARELYIVDGSLYNDQWVQDEFEIGYCWAPHAWMQVTLHNPRSRALGTYVNRELPSADMGLFNNLSWEADSMNFGGNLEVSPPVAPATNAFLIDQGGPDVAAHPAAPFGKILLGEGKFLVFEMGTALIGDLDTHGLVTPAIIAAFRAEAISLHRTTAVMVITAGQEWRISDIEDTRRHKPKEFLIKRDGSRLQVFFVRQVERDYKTFLEAQRVQPLLLIDTSWLKVGHVDEYMIFVPANSGPKRYRLLFASTALAVRMLTLAKALNDGDPSAHPLTAMFRGLRWGFESPPELAGSGASVRGRATISVANVLRRGQVFNNELQTLRLTPIENRLRTGLDLSDAEVIRIPVLFDSVPHGTLSLLGSVINVPRRGDVRLRTAAFMPNLVNMLVVDNHVMPPRPFGPRMLTADVVSILTAVGLSGVTTTRVARLEGHWFWAVKNTNASTLGTAFGVSAGSITSHSNNTNKFNSSGRVKNHWDKIWIPENNVDIFEAYVQLALEDIGLTVHWVDDWNIYHLGDGEVHCGTNTLRTPAEAATGYTGAHWWDAYHP